MVYKYMQYFLSLLRMYSAYLLPRPERLEERTGNNGDGDVDEEELFRCADAN